MRKYFLLPLLIALIPNMVFGASVRYSKLLHEKQRKMEQLEKCMGASKGLKVAGVSTLGLTAVGVAGNIYEAKAIKDNADTIEKKDKKIESLQKDVNKKQEKVEKKASDVQRKIDEAEDKPITDEEFAAIELEYKKNHCASDEHWDEGSKECKKTESESETSGEKEDCTDVAKADFSGNPHADKVLLAELEGSVCVIKQCESGFEPSGNGAQCIEKQKSNTLTYVSPAQQLINKNNPIDVHLTKPDVASFKPNPVDTPTTFSKDIKYTSPAQQLIDKNNPIEVHLEKPDVAPFNPTLVETPKTFSVDTVYTAPTQGM